MTDYQANNCAVVMIGVLMDLLTLRRLWIADAHMLASMAARALYGEN
jgi:hypothetical protein